MVNYDWFLKLKEEITLLNIESISSNNDVVELFKDYEWGLDEINLAESYDKIGKICLANLETLGLIINYINYLEEESVFFSKDDLVDMINMIKENYHLQDDYYLNIVNYILVHEKIINNMNEIRDVLDLYRESDMTYYSMIDINNKRIKRMIKKGEKDFE